MDEEKARAYAELASKMTELHASIALLTQNVDKMARTDAEVTSMTKIFQGVQAGLTADTRPREVQTPRQRMKRASSPHTMTARAPRPSTPRFGVSMASAVRFAISMNPSLRMDSPRPPQLRSVPNSSGARLHSTPGEDVSMSNPVAKFSIGRAPPARRAETPLQRHNRINGIYRSTAAAMAKSPAPFQCVNAARSSRTPSEPFVSPSFRARFSPSVRSVKPPVSTAKAKTKLDFSAETASSAPAAAKRIATPSSKRPLATTPRIEVLARRAQLFIREERWRDAMQAIKEALQLDPESSMLQTQQALVHNHLHVAESIEKKSTEAEASMKRRRAAERAQRSQQAERSHTTRSFYDVLDVHNSSTCDEIKNSYRALVRRHHPDKNRNTTEGEEIKCITEAYRVLSNPAQRRHYDASLRVKRQYP